VSTILERIDKVCQGWRDENRSEPDTLTLGVREWGELNKLTAIGAGEFKGMRVYKVKRPQHLSVNRQGPYQRI